MLPDFPKAKSAVRRQFETAIRSRVSNDPILSQIKQTRQHEGRRAVIRREDSSEDLVVFERGHQEFEVSREEMKTWDPETLLRKATRMAEGFVEAQTKSLFANIERVTEKTGNVIRATAGVMDQEAFLELQRKLFQDFDPLTGEPKGAMMIVHPDSIPELRATMEKWEQDDAFQIQLKAVKEEKLEEWRAREASRKLVD